MGRMDREQAFEFIRVYRELVKESNFEELYEQFDNITDYISDTHYLTDIFIEAGIDPLEYMDDMPRYYHLKSNLPENSSVKHVHTIGQGAFTYTTGIYTIDLSGVKYIDKQAFFGSSIKVVEIPDSVMEIQPYTFSYSDLVNVVINEGTYGILNEAFAYCNSLTDIWLPKSLTDVAASAFLSCTNLKNIYYNSTSYDFYNLNFNFNMIGSGKVDVHCTDKVITFYG